MDLKKSLHHFLWPLLVGLVAGCSTARSLQEGQYRLAKNKVEILNDDGLNISEITPYIKQQAKPSGPMTYIYSMGGKERRRLSIRPNRSRPRRKTSSGTWNIWATMIPMSMPG